MEIVGLLIIAIIIYALIGGIGTALQENEKEDLDTLEPEPPKKRNQDRQNR
jgi:hypothetical protein